MLGMGNVEIYKNKIKDMEMELENRDRVIDNLLGWIRPYADIIHTDLKSITNDSIVFRQVYLSKNMASMEDKLNWYEKEYKKEKLHIKLLENEIGEEKSRAVKNVMNELIKIKCENEKS
jgi:hypothetical protein